MATTTAAPATRAMTVGSGIQLAVALIWLGATMWAANASIVGNAEEASVALSSAAAALPGVIAASLLVGASAGLVGTTRLGGAYLRRLLTGLAAGALFGLIAAALILFGYGANASVGLLAGTVGAAAVLGGATAALPPPALLAGLAATSFAYLAGVLISAVQPQLTSVLGGGDGASVAAQASASTRFAYVQSIIIGLGAGLIAYRLLRSARLTWPWFLLAGALPGLLLLVAEALARLGGSSLFGIVKDFSEVDRLIVEFTDYARLRNALIVTFVGAIVAMIAVGRTLSPTSASPSSASPSSASPSAEPASPDSSAP